MTTATDHHYHYYTSINAKSTFREQTSDRRPHMIAVCDTTERLAPFACSLSCSKCLTFSLTHFILEILLILTFTCTTMTFAMSIETPLSSHDDTTKVTYATVPTLSPNVSVNTSGYNIIPNDNVDDKSVDNSPHEIEVDDETLRTHCVDSNGTLHGLFSTWREQQKCWCTCQPVGRVAMSLCDGCPVNPPPAAGESPHSTVHGAGLNGNRRLGTDTSNRTIGSGSGSNGDLPSGENDAERRRHSRGESEKQDGMQQELRKNCYYQVTRQHYRHSEIWMSANQACVKCQCNNGQVMCAGQPHHCPSICLPGQQNVHHGSCCETLCQGVALQNVTTKLENCSSKSTGVTYNHGEVMIASGTCVDQKCHCVNGRWNCLDFCTPLRNLSCSMESVVVWDPFCCPRCPGDLQCKVSINNIGVSANSPLKPKTTSVGDVPTSQNKREGPDGPQEVSTLAPAAADAAFLEKIGKVLTVSSGEELALKDGRCVCLNGSIYCSRPGRSIWHNDDCFYAETGAIHSGAGSYYSPGDRWTPTGDTCTECLCLGNLTYSCAPRRCTSHFVCSPGQRPTTVPGDCCPSTCAAEAKDKVPFDVGGGHKPDQVPSSSWVSSKDSSDRATVTRPPSLPKQPINTPKPTVQQPNVLENNNNEQMTALTGCLPLDAPNNHVNGHTGDQNDIKNVFPPGSRLLLSRVCRSLLCVCAYDFRWLCTEHCPPACGHTFESIENLNYVMHPPPGKCCPPCTNKMPVSYDRKGSQHYPDNGKSPSATEDGDWNQFNYPYTGGKIGISSSSSSSHDCSSQSGGESSGVQKTIQFYLLVILIVVLCIFGFPLTVFLTWYCIHRRRRKHLRQYRVRLHAPRNCVDAQPNELARRPISLDADTQSSNSTYFPKPVIYSSRPASRPSVGSVDHNEVCGPAINGAESACAKNGSIKLIPVRNVYAQNVSPNNSELVSEQVPAEENVSHQVNGVAQQITRPDTYRSESPTTGKPANNTSKHLLHSSVPSSPVSALRKKLSFLPVRHKTTVGSFRYKINRNEELCTPLTSQKTWIPKNSSDRNIRRVASSVSARNGTSPNDNLPSTAVIRAKSFLCDQKRDGISTSACRRGDKAPPAVRPPRPPRLDEKMISGDLRPPLSNNTPQRPPSLNVGDLQPRVLPGINPQSLSSCDSTVKEADRVYINDPADASLYPKANASSSNGTPFEDVEHSELDPLLTDSQTPLIPKEKARNSQVLLTECPTLQETLENASDNNLQTTSSNNHVAEVTPELGQVDSVDSVSTLVSSEDTGSGTKQKEVILS